MIFKKIVFKMFFNFLRLKNYLFLLEQFNTKLLKSQLKSLLLGSMMLLLLALLVYKIVYSIEFLSRKYEKYYLNTCSLSII